LVLYQVYPPPKPDSMVGLSSSQTDQLIRCPPYPPPTVGILISRVGILSFVHGINTPCGGALVCSHGVSSLSFGPAKARRISAGCPRSPAKLAFFPPCRFLRIVPLYISFRSSPAKGGERRATGVYRRPYGGPNDSEDTP